MDFSLHLTSAIHCLFLQNQKPIPLKPDLRVLCFEKYLQKHHGSKLKKPTTQVPIIWHLYVFSHTVFMMRSESFQVISSCSFYSMFLLDINPWCYFISKQNRAAFHTNSYSQTAKDTNWIVSFHFFFFICRKQKTHQHRKRSVTVNLTSPHSPSCLEF